MKRDSYRDWGSDFAEASVFAKAAPDKSSDKLEILDSRSQIGDSRLQIQDPPSLLRFHSLR